MTLSPGIRLGPYEVVAPLGVGGMGEVYRAQDRRLDRTVAVKVLHPRMANRPTLKERFDREARLISSLNHPHICALYDVGHEAGIDFLVMEYLEGETLAARLSKGALPTDQALRYASEITDALDQAHRQGIVHRDLKPGNIMLTKSGAKLLDFGLAKLSGADWTASDSDVTEIGSESVSLTEAGTRLGTFQYMAPEQVEGVEADARSDIFSFGSVLYEMLTGRKAFEGTSQASLAAAILSSEPPATSSLKPMIQPALERVVKRCLAKNPDDRWQTARDLMLELKWIAEVGPTASELMPPAIRQRSHKVVWLLGAAVLALALLVVALRYFPRARTDARATRFIVPPPEKSSFTSLDAPAAVSPNGRHLAFVATTLDGKKLLWLRQLDSLTAKTLPGTDGAYSPFWSPDSSFIGFFAEGKLKKIEATGGSPQTISDAPIARGGTWNRQGLIVFAPNSAGGLYVVSSAGGTARPLTTLDRSRQENSHRWPHFLPDGRHFIYFVRSLQRENRGVYIGSLDSKDSRRLLSADSSAAFAPPGYLLFVREGTLITQPFDAESLQITREPLAVADYVAYEPAGARPEFSVSDNGVLAYRSASVARTQLVWFDREGKQIGPAGPPGEYRVPSLSPDEKRIAFDRVDPQTGTRDIWLLDLSRGVTSRFTFDPSSDKDPLWSPDGSRIVFVSNRQGAEYLYQKDSTGAGSDDLLLKTDATKFPDDWSSDGQFIIYNHWEPKTKWDLWVLPLFGDRRQKPLLQTEFEEWQAQLSQNKRWIAYTSNESGGYEVYVQSFPPSGGRWQISTRGGAQPRWRRDGKALFYLAADKRLMAVDVKGTTAKFETGVPRPLFETRVPGLTDARNHYVVTGDGFRFLINTLVDEAPSSPLTVVLNWTAELKR